MEGSFDAEKFVSEHGDAFAEAFKKHAAKKTEPTKPLTAIERTSKPGESLHAEPWLFMVQRRESDDDEASCSGDSIQSLVSSSGSELQGNPQEDIGFDLEESSESEEEEENFESVGIYMLA